MTQHPPTVTPKYKVPRKPIHLLQEVAQARKRLGYPQEMTVRRTLTWMMLKEKVKAAKVQGKATIEEMRENGVMPEQSAPFARS